VALLGASYEEGKNIYTPEGLARRFSLDKLNKAPAVSDYKKLEWFNDQYIRMKNDEELAALTLPNAVSAGLFSEAGAEPDACRKDLYTAAMPLIRERLNFLHEAPEKLRYLFSEPEVPAPEEFLPKKADPAATLRLLRLGREICAPWPPVVTRRRRRLSRQRPKKRRSNWATF
jgi:glutamyl-tRNA synthetase